MSLRDAQITTLEGLADDPAMQVIKQAFHDKHGLQCGFCTSGMLISTRDLLKRTPNPSENAVRDGLSGNLCRCTGYQGIVRAVLKAAEDLAAS